MFIGREREMATLNHLYQSDKFEFVVIYRRRHFPSSALVVDAHIKRSDSMVGFLILIVEFGAVECVCAITLAGDA